MVHQGCRCPHCDVDIADVEERLTGLESAFYEEHREVEGIGVEEDELPTVAEF